MNETLEEIYGKDHLHLTILNKKQLRFLRDKGVIQVDPQKLNWECKNCGQIWQSNIRSGSTRLPKGYWKCPNGCNGEK